MKPYILLFIFFIGHPAYGQIETIADSIYIEIGLRDFFENVKKIDQYQNIYQISETDYKLKKLYQQKFVWQEFDYLDYRRKFVSKLNSSFSSAQLKKINLLARNNHFFVKILADQTYQRDLYSFYYDLFDGQSYKQKPKSLKRISLLSEIYRLCGYSLQLDKIKNLWSTMFPNKKTILRLRNGSGFDKFINYAEIESRVDSSEVFMKKILHKIFMKYRESELKEYIRVLAVDRNTRKFVQLYVNYHYYYFMNYWQNKSQVKIQGISS
ncbi:MAG: hypothetical protein QF441_05345 [Bacteriovoracaceae bacterium]|jgi:hypothetical protein|nr:hypothetical protein [Bacteriovoracaceae bacterium]